MTTEHHFYHYTADGFSQRPWPFEDDGEMDWNATLDKNGWEKTIRYGSEWAYEVQVYAEKAEGTGNHLVELMDMDSTQWIAMVPAVLWPRFIRDEILPIVSCANQITLADEVQRLADAVIAIGRHGVGESDLNVISGTSMRDERAEASRRKAMSRNADSR